MKKVVWGRIARVVRRFGGSDDPEWQGRGIGTEVYDELARRASADGYRRFVLDTGSRTTRRGFYEGPGFQCVREVALEYREATVEGVLYEKRVGD